jgi:cobalt-zinc-cadmium resistance protein CzcA
MLHSIIKFSIKNKLIIGLLTLGLIIGGVFAITKLPIDAVPDITNNQVLVITSVPSLGAPDVERFITVPIEQATRNVPGIIEQRSFSRFGLSLVTIVFNDDVDVYWARQQVSERLVQVQEQIPAGLGVPSLGPLTTGLGEIFQYVVRAKPGYEGKYNLAALRDIQDWIVRRQLLGTEGVADVSSFGGDVKQFEVAVNTQKLSSFQLTITDVFKALQENNQNTGGAYIERGPNVLFIRSEGLVKNMDDINSIVVKRVNGTVPVLIKDVATVQYGKAIRYGATLYNETGEVAGAVVMMLKGENSSKVIESIKLKIKNIEKSLPEGVVIEPFLDRTKMVNNAISTVETNLLEGALIVVFVLVLFLGNLRAGFVVASVIPLSMLFAIILMNAFGVSGNLMSLGALDFGLLVDGAVIIVEAVIHKLKHHTGFKEASKMNQHQMDVEVEGSAGKMMSSAVFGQIIILIVYLPILSLQGIEGKMFKPMAQTVSFAIIGAFILSLTYVPMMTALCLSKKVSHKPNISERVMERLQNWYKPILLKLLNYPKLIISSSIVLFGIALLIASNMGGEFIPKLEEGDFAAEVRMLTGTSLKGTIDGCTKAAKLVKEQFPEVEKVVVKIGSGEIPTDPMPMEAADLMIILKPKKEWTSAKTFDELAEKMSTALEDIPGIATGFQFPVQMRFNELMTGARQDVVCKIFGDDLDSLAIHANELGKIINGVEGAKDLFIETVTGVPQMVVTYNREAIARFGASINDINTTIESAYAGATAGLIFEGDKRYDLVVRLNNEQKQNVDGIENLMIGLPNGNQVPLNVLAKVALQDGPYQIQREDARRRITIGFNIRGRDVQSIVKELQEKVSSQIKFPSGYYITYGGAYENLQHATKRLSIALPLALLLILVMLYFAFNQLKYSLLIFSAIPLSAIGGVFALTLRDMPFSISAGVGFIALFGVAVLNGIVLIAEMNRLKTEHVHGIRAIIVQATVIRLRPVLMTAAVASLGFLPMAISNGAGAEVQRPLATVVIGGLLSATLLTLIVLPCLYLLIEEKKKIVKKSTVVKASVLLCFLMSGAVVFAQPTTQKMTLQEVRNAAFNNAQTLKVSKLQEQYHLLMLKTAGELPKTQFNTELGNYNSIFFDSKFSATQTFSSGGFYKQQKNLLGTYLEVAKAQTLVQKAELKKMVEQLYVELQTLQAKQLLLLRIDSMYNNYYQIAKLRFEKGETSLLEKTTLENKANQSKLALQLIEDDVSSIQQQLGIVLQTNIKIVAAESLMHQHQLFDTSLVANHPYLKFQLQQQQVAMSQTNVEKSMLKPDWFVGYNNQSLMGWQQRKDASEVFYNNGRRFSSIVMGVHVPLFAKPQKAKVEAAKVNEQTQAAMTELTKQQLNMQVQKYFITYVQFEKAVQYFATKGVVQSNLMIATAGLNYKAGQINYFEWSSLLQDAFNIQFDYIEALKNKQLTAVELNYLLQQ